MLNDIHELLSYLQEQEGAVLGRKSAEVLSAFLQGFALARRAEGRDSDQEFLNNFNTWVHRRYNFSSSTQGWAKIIGFQTVDEAAEWRLFWKLVTEFNEKRTKRRSRAEHTSAGSPKDQESKQPG